MPFFEAIAAEAISEVVGEAIGEEVLSSVVTDFAADNWGAEFLGDIGGAFEQVGSDAGLGSFFDEYGSLPFDIPESVSDFSVNISESISDFTIDFPESVSGFSFDIPESISSFNIEIPESISGFTTTSFVDTAINRVSTSITDLVAKAPALAQQFAIKQATTLANQAVRSAIGVDISQISAAAAGVSRGVDAVSKTISKTVSGSDVAWGVNPRIPDIIGKTIDSAGAAIPQTTPFDDQGNLQLGWTLNETGDPVFVGGGFVDETGKFSFPPAVNPNTNPGVGAGANGGDLIPGLDKFGSLLPGWDIINGTLVNVAALDAGLNTFPVPVDAAATLRAAGFTEADIAKMTSSTEGLPKFGNNSAATIAAAAIETKVKLAQQQQTIAAQRGNKSRAGDWRVRLRLAPRADYLYNVENPGILGPLKVTDGVVFPYTPAIDTAYKADYEQVALTHSNYRGYFYKGSYTEPINIKAVFTAQDTSEANYLLAVIHFFRSATKMFYGQDALRGAPPPLVFLSGLGEFQFNEHPCVISQFNYTLPSEVDYIRANSFSVNGTNILSQRNRVKVPTNPLSYARQRLATVGLTKGAESERPPTSLINNDPPPTYVPTKMEIGITLYPMQSRQQVSQQFSLENFANGNLLRGGFW